MVYYVQNIFYNVTKNVWNFETFGLVHYLLLIKTKGRQNHRKGHDHNIMIMKLIASPNFIFKYLFVGMKVASIAENT